jgi:hypothetical protein
MNVAPKRRRIPLALGAAIALALTPATLTTTSAQEFKLTPAKEIAANPHRYWARGVVFRDTLVSTPSQTQTKIADRVAFPFTTKTLGTCHAAKEIAPAIRDLPTGREYIFTATVYSEKRGLIRKRTMYRFLIDGVVIPASDAGALAQQAAQALAERAENDAYAKRLRTLVTLTTRVQELLSVIAAGEGIERQELFDPASEHFEKLISAARRAVNDLEVESGVPGREHLAQTLVALVALAENRLQTPAEEERPIEAAPSPPESPPVETIDPAPDEIRAEPAAPPPPIEEKTTVEPPESNPPLIEQPAPPAAKPAEEPLPRRRARALRDAKPVATPSLRLNMSPPAPVIEDEPEESKPPPAQPDLDTAPAGEAQIPDSLPRRADQGVSDPAESP